MEAALPYLVPAALAVFGQVQQKNALDDAASERRNILNQQLSRDADTAKKNSQLVTDEAKNFSGDQRANAMTAQEQAINAQEMNDLKTGANGQDIGQFNTSGDAGAVSDDFIKGKADRVVTEGNRLTSIARELAKTRSVGTLQQDEALRRGNLAGTLQDINSTNQNLSRATGLDAQAVQANTGLGQIASSIGMGLLSGQIGKGMGVLPEQLPAPVRTAVPVPVGGIRF